MKHAHAVVGIVLYALLMIGCAGDHRVKSDAPARPAADETDVKNRELSYGYGQLYRTASGLRHVKTLLSLKVESEQVEALIDDISDYAARLAKDLEELDKQYPSLHIDQTGLPTFETKRRQAVTWDQVFTMAPIVGKTGKAFERALLLAQGAVLNNLRFLSEVMHDAEKSRHRKTFLWDVRTRTSDLYGRISRLLEQAYFC
jgi:hypothetical protein